MFNKEKSNEIIKATLTADSYSLGAHWVYDETQLKDLPVDWDTLNAPQAMWHKGKKAGDFTHIGDQLHLINEFVQDKNTFDSSAYLQYWQDKMSTYEGYVDGATRNTLANIQDGKNIGSDSDDFSVIGRISPLLLVSKDEEEFVSNVQAFVKSSHNNQNVVDTATFFARLIFKVADGANIEEAINTLKDDFGSFVRQGIEKGIASKNKDTFTSIRTFGPACGVDEGLPGIVHLLLTYPNNLKELLVSNAKAGGDTSSRSMVATMIIVANSSSEGIPANWFEVNK